MPFTKSNNKYELDEHEHTLHMWTPLQVEVTKDYKFVPKSFLFHFFSWFVYFIIIPILGIYNYLWYGFRIQGREKLKLVKGGKITVTNHIHPMDCTFVSLATFPHKLYFPTLKSNLEIPVISKLIRLLCAIPIPSGMDAKKKFVKAIDTLLQTGKTVQIYPEVAMWPYHDRLRQFKNGAFEFAVKSQVPVIPMVYTFREPKGIWKRKRKPCITLQILDPVYPNKEVNNRKEAVIQLREQVYDRMAQYQLQVNKNR